MSSSEEVDKLTASWIRDEVSSIVFFYCVLFSCLWNRFGYNSFGTRRLKSHYYLYQTGNYRSRLQSVIQTTESFTA